MKMRSKEKIIFLVVLACTVGLGIWFLCSWLYAWPEKAIEREFARMRAQGEPVTLEEAAPPEIPDAENAALIYEQAFGLYYKPPEKEERRLSDISGKDLPSWTEEDIEAIREYVEKNQDCLRLLHQAGAKDKCRFDLDYDVWAVTLSAISYYADMRSCIRLIARDAVYRAKQGETEAALESCWAGFRIGKALMNEPILISQLVRYAIDGMVLWALEEVLSEGDASLEILRLLLKELDIEESRAAFTRCLKGERCYQIDLFELLIKDPARAWQMVLRGGGPPPQAPVIEKGYRIVLALSRPLIRRDEIFSLSIMRRMIDLSKLPYHQAKADLNKLERDMANLPFYRILSKMLLPSLTRSYVIEARHEAKIGLAQLALALKIYKAEKGKYPDALAELVPDILSQLPKDPFTGKDFVYKREGEGFLVYSLGENGTDEGGKWDEKRRYQHDIPWRCKR